MELLAVVPALLLLALVAWQLAAAAHAWLLAGSAARAGARAAEVGAPAREAALAVLPAGHARGARVATGADGRVRVRVRVPGVLPFPAGPSRVAASAGSAGAGR